MMIRLMLEFFLTTQKRLYPSVPVQTAQMMASIHFWHIYKLDRFVLGLVEHIFQMQFVCVCVRACAIVRLARKFRYN